MTKQQQKELGLALLTLDPNQELLTNLIHHPTESISEFTASALDTYLMVMSLENLHDYDVEVLIEDRQEMN